MLYGIDGPLLPRCTLAKARVRSGGLTVAGASFSRLGAGRTDEFNAKRQADLRQRAPTSPRAAGDMTGSAAPRTGAASMAGVLVDLDGTLMDTAPDLAAAANRMRADFGLPPLPLARIAAFVGKGAEVLVHRALTDDLNGRAEPEAFARGRTAFYAHYRDENGAQAVVFAGVPQALQQLRRRGLKLACVTNKPREFTLPLLAKVGLAGCFDAVVAGDEVAEKKPHPALLLEACRRLALSPAEVMLIGDSVNDAQAARAAGSRCVLVETGYNEGEGVASLAGAPGVDAIFATLAEAAQWILRRPATQTDCDVKTS
jgi:phosphoglycolate phosphatase